MMPYYVLASEEERAALAEPIGWRPVLDTNVSMRITCTSSSHR
jgi:hypothetical protein